MKKYTLLIYLVITLTGCDKSIAQTQSLQKDTKFMIRHTVIFKLKPSTDSTETANFFIAAKKLATIPGVQNFESLRQISKKNNYDFGLSMEFANEGLYEQYNKHPLHVQFIQQYWLVFVEDFMEIDYKPYNEYSKSG